MLGAMRDEQKETTRGVARAPRQFVGRVVPLWGATLRRSIA